MSYHIYTTKGIVLGARPYSEADRVYTVLTRDLGLIRASALGVRKEISKLRGNLEPYSLACISFVKGKERWRITSAEFISRIPNALSIASPLSLLEKLIQGEEAHPELFDEVENSILSTHEYDSNFEISFVSRLLYHLGYLKESDLLLDKQRLIKVINSGLESSQLT